FGCHSTPIIPQLQASRPELTSGHRLHGRARARGDVVVGIAATDVPDKLPAHFDGRKRWFELGGCVGGHCEPGDAEATLTPVLRKKSLEHRCEIGALRQALDGCYGAPSH